MITINRLSTNRISIVTMHDGVDYTSVVDGIEWTFKVVDGRVIVERSGSRPAISTDIEGEITVPPRLGGLVVTGIGNCAFENCKKLTKINLPNSI